MEKQGLLKGNSVATSSSRSQIRWSLGSRLLDNAVTWLDCRV